jgi:hypothetical protein
MELISSSGWHGFNACNYGINVFVMRNILPFILSMLAFMSSCKIAGGIFKAGFWSAIILIVAVVLLIIYLVGKAKGKGGSKE